MTETSTVAITPSERITVLEPRGRLRLLDLREIWEYRELLWVLTLRDISVRYKQTVLGVAWAVLRPTLSMLIFSIVFGRLAKLPSDGVPYPIFVFAGMLPWMFFAQAVSGASGSVIGAGSLITRVYFPRLIVPLASAGVALVDFAVSMLLLVPLMLWYGVTPSTHMLLIPVLVLAAILVALGIGIWLSAITVAYRDFRHIEPFMLQIWMFATPVVYPASLIPEQWRWLAFINPMTGVVEGFRSAWLGLPIAWSGIGISLTIGAILFVMGVLYFERVERKFADLI